MRLQIVQKKGGFVKALRHVYFDSSSSKNMFGRPGLGPNVRIQLLCQLYQLIEDTRVSILQYQVMYRHPFHYTAQEALIAVTTQQTMTALRLHGDKDKRNARIVSGCSLNQCRH